MTVFLIILIIVIFIAILCTVNVLIYNKYQILIIKSNEAEANIDTNLRKRFDLLNKSINIIKENVDSNKEVMEDLTKLKSKKISNFDLDRKLYDSLNEFDYYKENFPNLMDIDSFKKISEQLKDSEYEIIALRKFYNDTITEYNILIRKFPSNIVGKILKYKEKNYYDGKNLNDDIINDFKI